MKRLVLTLGLIFFQMLGLAQGNERTVGNRNNELKLNSGYLLGEYLEFSYERLLNDESSIGLSAGIPLSDYSDTKLTLFPYYRLFFGNKPAAGFFLEANLAYWNYEYTEIAIFGGSSPKEESLFGVGLAVGGKFLTKKGWIGELFAGGGRNLSTSENDRDAYPRFGILIGKRF